MIYILCLLFSFNAKATTIQQDRDTVIRDVRSSVIISPEYQELKKRVLEIEDKVNNGNNKKTTVKTIGYTSSTLGVISSIWAIYEKTLSLKNSKIELDIRNSIKDRILIELETIKDEQLLLKKRENLGEVNEKISNIKMRMRISRMGLQRGIFKGVTSVGLFIITIFVDDISDYINGHGKTRKEVYLNLLNTWDKKIIYATMFPVNDIDRQLLSLMYFMDGDKDWDEALLEYKNKNIMGYAYYQTVAKFQLQDMLIKTFRHRLYYDIISQDEYNKDGYYKAKRDGTQIKNIFIKDLY